MSLLSPPSIRNIYCIGRNYAKHAAELGNKVLDRPLVFLKSTAALRGLEGGAVAFATETFHHEVELVFRVAKTIDPEKAPGRDVFSHVTLGIDLTRRPEQERIKKDGHPWTLAKSFKGSAIVGPWLAVDSTAASEATYEFELAVNGEQRQKGNSRDMLHKPLALSEYVHSFSPLQEGDIIFSGTPEGVGPLRIGDSFTMKLNWEGGSPTVWQGRL